MSEEKTYLMYRKSTIGLALENVLRKLIQERKLSENQASNILDQFDKSINVALSKLGNSKISLDAHCKYFKNMGNVWQFVLSKAELRGLETACVNPNETFLSGVDNNAKSMKVVLIEDASTGKKRKRKK